MPVPTVAPRRVSSGAVAKSRDETLFKMAARRIDTVTIAALRIPR
jgi:hypothetical protein